MNKDTVHSIISVILMMSGIGMLLAGIAIPPIGVIDNSILVAFGEILTFVGGLFGMDYHYKYKDCNRKQYFDK